MIGPDEMIYTEEGCNGEVRFGDLDLVGQIKILQRLLEYEQSFGRQMIEANLTLIHMNDALQRKPKARTRAAKA
jgi:hypothetical protein